MRSADRLAEGEAACSVSRTDGGRGAGVGGRGLWSSAAQFVTWDIIAVRCKPFVLGNSWRCGRVVLAVAFFISKGHLMATGSTRRSFIIAAQAAAAQRRSARMLHGRRGAKGSIALALRVRALA